MTDHAADILVVGAGPAGMAAAVRAAELGRSVILLDENPAPGGQIWRGPTDEAQPWIDRANAAGVRTFSSSALVQPLSRGAYLASTPAGPARIAANATILATGGRELFLPFPGWDLPGVFGVGALQALAKSGYDLAGKNILVAGSGPLLLAVSAWLRETGSNVLAIAEQADPAQVRRFALSLIRWPSKVRQALSLKFALLGVPYWTGSWPVRAEGDTRLRSVVLADGLREMRVECDILACGFGLVPETHLASALGCEVRTGAVVVDDFGRTSVGDVYAAGELTGIGGHEKSLVEGQIAGLAAAGREDLARDLLATLARAKAFAGVLAEVFRLRRELRSLPTHDTIVCRCEDVSWSRVKGNASWREAKIQTRCGMGPCQGRICGPAVSFLTGWEVADARPPISPASVSTLLSSTDDMEAS